jgi:cardiolipin synthase
MARERRLVSEAWTESLKPRLLPGHQIDLLRNGAQYFPALIDAIKSAKRSVFLEAYIFQNDATGKLVANALADASRRAVAVHLLVDGFGTLAIEGEVARILSACSVQVRTFRPEPKRFTLNRQRLRRMHRKLCVVDGELAFVGGINVLDDLFDPNHGVLDAPRFDFAVRVRGPSVAKVHLAVQRLWWEVGLVQRLSRERLMWPDEVQSTITAAGRHRAMFVVRDNLRFRRTIERFYLRAIGRAKRDILIANAYFLPGHRFRNALLAARARGVRVRLLLQGRVEYRLQHYASQALYDELLRAGIEIIEYTPSFLHAKVAVIDDWATVGSSNIDPFSLLLAREANIMVVSSSFAGELRAELEKAIDAGGRPVILRHHEARPWPVRLMNKVAFFLLRLGVALSGRSGRY